MGNLVKLALSLLILVFVAWFVATLIGIGLGSVPVTAVLRTLASLLVIALVVRRHVSRPREAPEPAWAVPVAALVAYALTPAAWVGRALIGQVALDPGPLTVVIDLVVWVGMAVLVARSTPTTTAEPRRPYQAA
ncbi:hypothetical protein [Nocardioides sp. Kera G14]|uniref:hypothetical protein n=1 Tax=Nocardioides sp. Kera G14 TaxID=2884264 RepID=UPI001D10E429|nr:hypothetical protein [Nocardioides sp. Kera G14]UDY23772.1 hypothetical protein LH076_00295 [Nocardioides sp. Kera G14]